MAGVQDHGSKLIQRTTAVVTPLVRHASDPVSPATRIDYDPVCVLLLRGKFDEGQRTGARRALRGRCRDVFDIEVVGEATSFPAAFPSFDRRDHDLALFQRKESAPLGNHDFNHLALEFGRSLKDYKAAYHKLKERGVKITGTVDHGGVYGIYFLDPNGHTLELYFSTIKPGDDPLEAFRTAGAMATPIDIETLSV